MHRSEFTITPQHPSLPGHFPGLPVVPGVVVLDEVRAAAQAWLGPLRVAGLPQVKFMAPLLPGQRATLELQHAGGQLRFAVACGGQPVALGTMELVAACPGPTP